MNADELCKSVALKLRRDGLRKPIRPPQEEFTISDSSGEKHTFRVQGSARSCMYTIADVATILETAAVVAVDALAKGDSVHYKSFGKIAPKYYRSAPAGNKTQEEIMSDPLSYGSYRAKFTPGTNIKQAYKYLNIALREKQSVEDAKISGLLTTEFEDDFDDSVDNTTFDIADSEEIYNSEYDQSDSQEDFTDDGDYEGEEDES